MESEKKYYLYRFSKKRGPYSRQELISQHIRKNTLIWHRGLKDWQPAAEVQELNELFIDLPPSVNYISIIIRYFNSIAGVLVLPFLRLKSKLNSDPLFKDVLFFSVGCAVVIFVFVLSFYIFPSDNVILFYLGVGQIFFGIQSLKSNTRLVAGVLGIIFGLICLLGSFTQIN